MTVFIVRAFRKRFCGAIVAVTSTRKAADAFVEKSRDEEPAVAFIIDEHEVDN